VSSQLPRRIIFLIALPLLAQLAAAKQSSASPRPLPNGPSIIFSEERFEFGEVLSGAIVEHDFTVRNRGVIPISIEKVSMTTPLLVTQMPRQVGPGGEGKIHFKLDTASLEGEFEGAILLFLDDPALPEAQLTFAGRIVPPVELSPRPAFFVAGQRGTSNRAAIEIVNHESEPLNIEKMEEPTERFTTQLETLQPGQRYRLTLVLKPDGPGGRAFDTILLRTSSKLMPVLRLGANTFLFERVHAFPDVLDFGTWRAGDAGQASATLMIHQEGGTDFKVRLSTDVPGLSLRSERGPAGDRYQAEAGLDLQRIPVGPLKGAIFIDTNDAQFPRIIVPVRVQIISP